ncbi:unnamed protein product, partial [Iphiclides podalirius]
MHYYRQCGFQSIYLTIRNSIRDDIQSNGPPSASSNSSVRYGDCGLPQGDDIQSNGPPSASSNSSVRYGDCGLPQGLAYRRRSTLLCGGRITVNAAFQSIYLLLTIRNSIRDDIQSNGPPSASSNSSVRYGDCGLPQGLAYRRRSTLLCGGRITVNAAFQSIYLLLTIRNSIRDDIQSNGPPSASSNSSVRYGDCGLPQGLAYRRRSTLLCGGRITVNAAFQSIYLLLTIRNSIRDDIQSNGPPSASSNSSVRYGDCGLPQGLAYRRRSTLLCGGRITGNAAFQSIYLLLTIRNSIRDDIQSNGPPSASSNSSVRYGDCGLPQGLAYRRRSTLLCGGRITVNAAFQSIYLLLTIRNSIRDDIQSNGPPSASSNSSVRYGDCGLPQGLAYRRRRSTLLCGGRITVNAAFQSIYLLLTIRNSIRDDIQSNGPPSASSNSSVRYGDCGLPQGLAYRRRSTLLCGGRITVNAAFQSIYLLLTIRNSIRDDIQSNGPPSASSNSSVRYGDCGLPQGLAYRRRSTLLCGGRITVNAAFQSIYLLLTIRNSIRDDIQSNGPPSASSNSSVRYGDCGLPQGLAYRRRSTLLCGGRITVNAAFQSIYLLLTIRNSIRDDIQSNGPPSASSNSSVRYGDCGLPQGLAYRRRSTKLCGGRITVNAAISIDILIADYKEFH